MRSSKGASKVALTLSHTTLLCRHRHLTLLSLSSGCPSGLCSFLLSCLQASSDAASSKEDRQQADKRSAQSAGPAGPHAGPSPGGARPPGYPPAALPPPQPALPRMLTLLQMVIPNLPWASSPSLPSTLSLPPAWNALRLGTHMHAQKCRRLP